MKNIKSKNAATFISSLILTAIPYLYITFLIILNIIISKVIALSVKYVYFTFCLKEAQYIFLGIFTVIYVTFIKKFPKVKLFASLNILVLFCLIILPYANYNKFKFLYDAQSFALFFIGINLYFLIKSIISVHQKEESI